MTLELTVLGCSGSGPAPGSPASGYLVRSAESALWMDAGTGTFMELARYIDPADVSAVTLSHLHADHCVDFLGFFHYVAYRLEPAAPIPVFLPPGGATHLAAFLGAQADHAFWRVFDLEEIDERTHRFVGDLELEFAPADHSVPCNAVRVGSAGRTLVFSGDTGPGGEFAALATGADAVLCEAGLAEVAGGEGPQHHMSGADAGQIAAAAGAERLILTHLAPTLRPEDIHAAAAEKYSGPIVLAEPGLQIAV